MQYLVAWTWACAFWYIAHRENDSHLEVALTLIGGSKTTPSLSRSYIKTYWKTDSEPKDEYETTEILLDILMTISASDTWFWLEAGSQLV